MYSKSAWGGNVDPYIQVVFVNDTVKPDTDPIISLLIFEWKDLDLIGVEDPNRPGEVKIAFQNPLGKPPSRPPKY